MNRSTLVIVFFLSIAAALLGYNYFLRPFANFGQRQEQPPQVENTANDQPAQQEGPISLIINQLTPQQKVLQLIAAPLVVEETFDQDSPAITWLNANNAGFVTFFGSKVSFDSAKQVSNFLVQRYPAAENLQPIFAVDHEGGTVQRLAGQGFSKLPSWRSVCQATASSQIDENTKLLRQSADELSQAGVSVVFAPVVDIAVTGSYLGSRACSNEIDTVVNKAQEFITIFQKQSILPVIKHFPGIGAVTADLHKSFALVEVGAQQAQVYKQLLATFPRLGVMTTHVGVLNQYPDIPCSLSPDCVAELTNNFPDVLVFTDALDMKAAGFSAESNEAGNQDQEVDLAQRSLKAILAGNDVLVFGAQVDVNSIQEVVNKLTDKYQSEQEVRDAVDASLKKIIEFKMMQAGRSPLEAVE